MVGKESFVDQYDVSLAIANISEVAIKVFSKSVDKKEQLFEVHDIPNTMIYEASPI
jgi:hypothetical protein